MRNFVPLVCLLFVVACDSHSPTPTPTLTVTVTPEPEPIPTVTVTPACPSPTPAVEYPSQMPNETATLMRLDEANPGMLKNDCAGFLRLAVQTLQAKNPNWGYCNKPHKNKVPADILMYRGSNQLVDYSIACCSPDARIGWQAMEPPNECTWGATADFPIM